jgi:hypothetical protein
LDEIPHDYLAALLDEVEAARSASRETPDETHTAARKETNRAAAIQFSPVVTSEQRRILQRVADALLADEGPDS